MSRQTRGSRLTRGSRRAAIIWVTLLTVAALAAVSVQARHHHSNAGHPGTAGKFDYYLLSLSWAPTYCLTHSDDGDECASKGYRFVLHGLWPQYEGGGYPEQCQTDHELSDDAAAKGGSIYPSPRLMSHEWQTHGTCSGLSALEYFRTADRSTASLRIPVEFDAPRADSMLSAPQIVDLFRKSNPSMPDGSMTLACSRASMSEIRVCLTRDLAPRTCGQGVRTSCPDAPLRIPASR
jgi:ribonuclease T2